MGNYEFNRLGRVWVLWKPEVKMMPVYKTAQIVTCSFLLPGEKRGIFLFICVCFQYYGRKKRALGRFAMSL